MRLFVRSSEGLTDITTVEPARSTLLCFDATCASAGVVDVLCLRPDGLTWHLGSTAGRPGAHHYEVELSPFTLPGSHVLSVEVGGRPLPGQLKIEVLSMGRAPTRRNRRYLGRGLPKR